MEDIFVPSSPPRASSSPISLHKDISVQNIDNEQASSSYCQENSLFSPKSYTNNPTENKNTNALSMTSPKTTSASIEASLTIRPLKNAKNNETCNEEINKSLGKIGNHSKGHGVDSNLNTGNFTSIPWTTSEADNIQDDNKDPDNQHKRKSGDTPTEVFKVAALYVT